MPRKRRSTATVLSNIPGHSRHRKRGDIMTPEEILRPIIAAAQGVNPRREGDYEQDGILYCGRCKTPKQARIAFSGETQIVPCLCNCADAEYKREEAERKKRERFAEIKALRIYELQDPIVHQCSFDLDDGANPATVNCQRYADKWENMRGRNLGLLLWGNTGNGKTFAAACIANQLMKRGVPVLMVSFVRLLNVMQGLQTETKSTYLDSMNAFPLVILDDFGAERDTSFSLEQVYSVIDTRYKQNKPLIVTTNMALGELQKPSDMRYQRIYDRVLEMCVPIQFLGKSRREGTAAEKMKLAKAMFE